MMETGSNGNVMTDGAPRPTSEEFVHLEQRVRRLEDAVVQLQDTRPLEERVVERLSARQQLAAVREAEQTPSPSGSHAQSRSSARGSADPDRHSGRQGSGHVADRLAWPGF